MHATTPHSHAPEGHSTWSPRHRSPAARMAWLAFGAGDTAGWSGGRLEWPAAETPDAAFLPSRSSACERPDWVQSLADALDAALPPAGTIEAALDACSLTVDPASAAFRMPSSPDAAGAGTCLLAARMLLAFREEVMPPMFSSQEECAQWLETATTTALMVGGRAAWLFAAAAAKDPLTWAVSEQRRLPDRIDFGDLGEPA